MVTIEAASSRFISLVFISQTVCVTGNQNEHSALTLVQHSFQFSGIAQRSMRAWTASRRGPGGGLGVALARRSGYGGGARAQRYRTVAERVSVNTAIASRFKGLTGKDANRCSGFKTSGSVWQRRRVAKKFDIPEDSRAQGKDAR